MIIIVVILILIMIIIVIIVIIIQIMIIIVIIIIIIMMMIIIITCRHIYIYIYIYMYTHIYLTDDIVLQLYITKHLCLLTPSYFATPWRHVNFCGSSLIWSFVMFALALLEHNLGTASPQRKMRARRSIIRLLS